jgi:hypothetical protein
MDCRTNSGEKVTDNLQEKATELTAKTKVSIKKIGKVTEDLANIVEQGKAVTTPYRDALMQGTVGLPVQVNQRVRAKESIRARQFLWTFSVEIPELRSLSAPQLLKQLNKKLVKAAKTMNEECKLRSALWLKNGGLLIEASDDKSVVWLHREVNVHHMECELGTTIFPKLRNYNTMAYFVLLTFNANEKTHTEEVIKANDLPNGSISKCRWAKAPEQQSPNQMVGHVVITFADPDSVNKAILNGLVICNKKVSVTKCKREPVRCLKCQGYNHIANKCIIQRDICARCGGSHRTNNCSESTLLCTPCSTCGHTSNDQPCPTL